MRVLPSYEGGRVERLAFSADGRWLVSVAAHPQAHFRSAPPRLWDRFDGTQLYVQPVPAHYGRCLALAADGGVSAWEATTRRGQVSSHVVCLWDTLGSFERLIIRTPHALGRPVAFSRDARWLAVADAPQSFGLFDTATGRKRATLSHPEAGRIRAIAFSPQADVLAAAGHVGLVLFDLKHRGGRITAGGHRVVWSPPAAVEQLVFSSSGGAILLRMGKEMALWRDGLRNWWVNSLRLLTYAAFSPDERTLALASADGSVTFWDVDGNELRSYRWDIGALGAVAFAPDGMTCAAGGEEGRIVIWDLDD